MSDGDDFHGLNPDEFDWEKTALEEAAKQVVNLFHSFQSQGLSVQEAAALTAAFFSQSMPWKSPPPQED